jgi:HD-GYP domain-containing protein (c-di-GMP phosphodiesterase class II)
MKSAIFRRVELRFQHWVVIAALLLAAALLAALLAVAFDKGARIAERTAQSHFGEISRQTARELEERVHASSLFVMALARSSPEPFAPVAGQTPTSLLPVLLSALENDVATYSHYFALANGDFVQAIGVRGDARVMTALRAPSQTHFATRVIGRNASGTRMEHWQFLASDRHLLGGRSASTEYDPVVRPWYQGAMQNAGLALTPPYVFASNHELGLTLAHPLPGNIGVMGTDISLRSLAVLLGTLSVTDQGAVMVLDGTQRVLAFHGRAPRYQGLDIAPLAALATVGSPYLEPLRRVREGAAPLGQVRSSIEDVGSERFVYTDYVFEPVKAQRFRVVAFAPMSDFNGPTREARRDLLLAVGLILLLLLPLVAWTARRMSRQLVRLTRQSDQIRQLNFEGEAHIVHSPVLELNTLAQAQAVMRGSIRQRTQELKRAHEKLTGLVDTGLNLAREQDRTALLRQILFGGRDIAHCQAATLFLKTPENSLRFAMRTLDDDLPAFELPLFDPATGQPNDHFMSTFAALHNQAVVIDDVYAETRFDMSGTKRFSEESGLRAVSMLTLPLSPRDGEVIGVLQFINAVDQDSAQVVPFDAELVGFLQALAAQAAVALDNQNLLQAQKELMDALIRLLAGAIDAKSPYTGGHCERVPELATLLAQEACQVSEGPLAEFSFKTEDEWREFHVGAWLHDCGKVTTPEFVVDKATKLETIYNRIHEIRTRFEVLRRDAEIDHLRALAAGSPALDAGALFEARCRQLQDDFAFLAESNLGGEFMSPERMARVRQIGEATWLRHFDDRLGLSGAELRRYQTEPAAALPAREHLLADQAHHIVPRDSEDVLDPKYEFKVQVPRNRYNFGEVYNLSISRGTLSEEERFKINDHIIQTIVMLSQLPLPKHLRRVPEYAGTHHETLIGTGYPRRLAAEQLSVPSRIMAIADIFEALTASDRPYKQTKTLSESIKILWFFKKDKHIDADLFDLFLSSGLYLRYAERFMLPSQIDAVDIAPYLGPVP